MSTSSLVIVGNGLQAKYPKAEIQVIAKWDDQRVVIGNIRETVTAGDVASIYRLMTTYDLYPGEWSLKVVNGAAEITIPWNV